MVDGLTDRQKQVLKAIADAMRNNGRPPSIPELMQALNVASPNGIAKHLQALEAKGYLARERGARGIRLLQDLDGPTHGASGPEAAGAAYVPLVGNIAAGSPILAEENVEEIFAVPDSMIDSGSDTFFLRVKGDSMIEEGIMPGDLVMIGRSSSVLNGELAAIMVDDEATVKRFYHRGDKIVLEPANQLYEPIVINAGSAQCAVIGKVIGLLRSYKTKL